jgi:hypothetical protein
MSVERSPVSLGSLIILLPVFPEIVPLFPPPKP